MPYNTNTELIIIETANELISLIDTLEKLRKEMNCIASHLPEYPAVLALYDVGTTLGPQLIVEIGDVRHFHNRKALIAYTTTNTTRAPQGAHQKGSILNYLERAFCLTFFNYM